MNERIDELWGQALDAAVPETYTKLSYSQVLKIKHMFVELLVKECGVALSPMLRDMVSRGQAFDLIKKHFGVEE